MRVLLFVLLVALLAVPAVASVTQITSPASGENALCQGWNLIGLPGIPLYPEPPTVFGSTNIDNRLYRWDNPTGSLKPYDPWDPANFGNMLLTDGYWLQLDSATQISYQGLNDSDAMDVWVSLPKAGWTLMGNPFSYNFEWPNAKVTDGNTTISITEAAKTFTWLSSIAYWWDAESQSLTDIGVPDDFPNGTTMKPWHGFWVQSNMDKIALIFESL